MLIMQQCGTFWADSVVYQNVLYHMFFCIVLSKPTFIGVDGVQYSTLSVLIMCLFWQ